MRNIRRKQVEHNRKKRQLVILTVGILLFVYFSFSIIMGDNGLLKYLKLRAQKDQLLAEIQIIKKQNNEVRQEIGTLEKTPELLEEFARGNGLTKDGELIFRFDERK